VITRATSGSDDAAATVVPALDVKDLRVRFQSRSGPVHAVNGVELQVGRAETVGIVGESGCGKSVTGLALMRLLPASAAVSGSALLEDVDLLELPERAMRRLRGERVAMVFQDPLTSLNPVLTIREQLVEMLRGHRDLSRRDATERARELLAAVGLPKPDQQLTAHPHRLSGGMQQRVMIAIALALSPPLLIADEPTTALDVTTQAQILEQLERLVQDSHTAVLLITHNLGILARAAQRVVVMYAGFVVEVAPTADLFAAPLHPYTVGLLQSIVRLDDLEAPLRPITGSLPDPHELPRGCPFAPRCLRRLEICEQENPPLADVFGRPPDHLTACHNPHPR
jgi:peptide/nickel transport system ATP-binding protein